MPLTVICLPSFPRPTPSPAIQGAAFLPSASSSAAWPLSCTSPGAPSHAHACNNSSGVRFCSRSCLPSRDRKPRKLTWNCTCRHETVTKSVRHEGEAARSATRFQLPAGRGAFCAQTALASATVMRCASDLASVHADVQSCSAVLPSTRSQPAARSRKGTCVALLTIACTMERGSAKPGYS